MAEGYLIEVKGMKVDFLANLFLKTCIEKVIYPKYSRDFLATWASRVQDDFIYVPAKNNNPDFSFMQTFISAIQKLAIKDVVLYNEAKLAAARQIVAKQI